MFRVWIVYDFVDVDASTTHHWSKYYDVSKMMEARALGVTQFMKDVNGKLIKVKSVEVDEFDENRFKQFETIN